MKIPWLRRNFLGRRWLDRIFLDLPDALYRKCTGDSHWPPYSLRSFVGGGNFDEVGRWFLDEFRENGWLSRGTHILDIGCGCGRVAYALAADSGLDIHYAGMDIDARCVDWRRRNITPLNPRFTFYRADIRNISYNPRGAVPPQSYRFPHPDATLDFILLTSVFTHLLEEDLRHYLSEIARLLAPGGIAYASFFLLESAEFTSDSPSESANALHRRNLAPVDPCRHGIAFTVRRGHLALNRTDYATNAIPYEERFVRQLIRDAGLQIVEPTRYGVQDLFLLTRVN